MRARYQLAVDGARCSETFYPTLVVVTPTAHQEDLPHGSRAVRL
jgi:hypothetical protein